MLLCAGAQLLSWGAWCADGRDRLLGHLDHLGRDRGGEGGSFARFTGDGEVATHDLAKLTAQGQSQARAAVFLGR